ncbi:hypothetical protein [Polyangium sp. 15x6]|uniref:hypothetical protein n=1 Tax=Polyangium sp. 15x6 TaxID=3042687 RepID=UPI002499ED92|nr:hypothetical protein [Polyangium sp. 15x6]MDI3289053.1 hypothetical protein [Polyangium sp. 15x6]
MATTLKVMVFDVDNRPVEKCKVDAGVWHSELSSLALNSRPNEFIKTDMPEPLPNETWTIKATHPDYFEESTDFNPSNPALWTNPTCNVTRTGSELWVKFILGRMKLAQRSQLKAITPADLSNLSNLKTSPDGVLMDGPRETFRYKDLFDGERTDFIRLNDPILRDPTEDAWKRLNAGPSPEYPHPNPSKEGHFRWLEFGPGKRKYLVAIWVPKAYFTQPTTKFDFIVMQSPTTKGKTRPDDGYALKPHHTYPYGLNDPTFTKRKTAHQPFLSTLGQEYLFERLNLTPQLIAANRKAIIVLPINNYGDWGPFTNTPGVHRMLLEIAHLTHKHFNGSLEGMYPIARKHNSIPAIGRVVVAGYSEGTEPLLGLFRPIPENLDPLVSVRDKSKFGELWKELWDLDLSLGGPDGFKHWIGNNFLPFLRGGEGRRLRMYHSEYTAGKWRPTLDPTLSELIPAKEAERRKFGRTVFDAAGGILAEEYQGKYAKRDGHWSVVYLSYDYLKPKTHPVTSPEYPDGDNGKAHAFIANTALGHAALVSNLDFLRPPGSSP